MATRSPLKFISLVFALSIPFYLAGALTSFRLVPGVSVSGLAVICPVAAALILVYQQNKFAGMVELLKRSFDFKRVRARVWYLPIFLLMPALDVLMYTVLRSRRIQVPLPQFPVVETLALAVGFFVGALGEELGWSGYAIDPLQDRWGAIQASLLLGIVWAIWHIVPLMQVHRPAAWIAWWCLGTVAARVLIVWLYNNTGKSVFVAAVFHAMMNLSWQLFPIHGSYFDEPVNSLLMVLAAAFVIVVLGRSRLTRQKSA